MIKRKLFCVASIALLAFSGCTGQSKNSEVILPTASVIEETEVKSQMQAVSISVDGQTVVIPAFTDKAVVEVNGNIPFFSEDDYTTEPFEYYSDFDEHNRCGVAYANICKEIMPTEERGEIGHIKPSGWHTVKYDCVDGKYLYNRCHLIGFQLAGENDNALNLVTGTRYFNVDSMLPNENMVDDYVDETGNHVLYRVTPVYYEDNLLCNGVLMEAFSVEDNGDGLQFCVFAYNIQPSVSIDYATGESWLSGVVPEEPKPTYKANEKGIVFVLNTKTKKYHLDTCGSVAKIAEENRESFNGGLDWLDDNGYEACKVCHPREALTE